MSQSPPRSILIVRLSAIGDVILASGLIPALRLAYPDARLAWLTDAPQADLLRHNPRLDQLHLWPRRRWRELRQNGEYRQLLREVAGLVRELRAERYDWVLDLQGLLKSGVWAYAAGGQRRIGLGSREGSGLLMTEVLDRNVASPLIGKEYRKLAGFLGADNFALDIAVSAADRAEAAAIKADAGITGAYAVIAPFTTRPQKHWFDERWAELAQKIQAERGWPVLMLGGPADRAHAAALRALAGDALTDLVGQTSLGLCAALIENARGLVGVDTGLTHLGIALKTPTLALFGSTRPYLDTGSPTARVLYQALDCSPCRRRPTCGGTYDCMRLHSPAAVLAALAPLLETAA
ncbi:heptosyltransferase-1 [Methylomagnum ishizawai]|uniref:Heptosyltransferase-1 n=1 Tax=Methylomagnum ishizawai TaxID=1760988 RepID=A0A1Y6CZ55_9GAMM|nr:glycosyltransferase family 9 protein [Methylomagnum ishizawai]SMF93592.1 heptosyltransferase-1 [Methylomagnum ishizawai]